MTLPPISPAPATTANDTLAPFSPTPVTTAAAAIAVRSNLVGRPLGAQVVERPALVSSIIQGVINKLPLLPSTIRASTDVNSSASVVTRIEDSKDSGSPSNGFPIISNRGDLADASPPPNSNTPETATHIDLSSTTHVGTGENLAGTSPQPNSNSP